MHSETQESDELDTRRTQGRERETDDWGTQQDQGRRVYQVWTLGDSHVNLDHRQMTGVPNKTKGVESVTSGHWGTVTLILTIDRRQEVPNNTNGVEYVMSGH